MLQGEAADRLVAQWQAQVARISQGAVATKASAWDSLGSWNRADIARYDAVAVRVDAAAKQAAVSSSEGFYATLTERPVVGLSADSVPSIRPDPRDPFTTVWHQLKMGTQFDDALASGRAVLEGTTTKHIVNTSRMTGDAWAEASGVRMMWRRVLTGVSCEWCALVSTQAYRSAASATFGHDTCDCLVVPTEDPGYSQNVRRRGVLDQGLADRLDSMGVQRRVAEQQASSRSLNAAANAERRRDEALRRMASESDPTKKQLLESRARRWDREAQRYRAQAAEQAARPRSQGEGTGYVRPDGSPAPRP
jgi:hypothetical protein